MRFIAVTKYISYSPYKLRPIANVIRGKNASQAMNWLAIYNNKRSIPVKKTLKSAIANAYDINKIKAQDLIIEEIRVDQGPIRYYFKPGAMGRAMHQRTRQCHVTVVLKPKKEKEA